MIRLAALPVALSLIATPAIAQPDPCFSFAQMSAEVMRVRQQDAPLAEVMQATTLSEGQDPEAAYALAQVIMEAYNEPIAETLPGKIEAIKQFSLKKQALCEQIQGSQ